MLTPEFVSSFQSSINSGETILIIFPSKSSGDIQASVSALYKALLSAGKKARLLTPLLQENYIFPDLREAHSELGQENLVISFPYTPEKVDKVSYHISEDTQQFFLTVKPKTGSTPLDTQEVSFKYTGASADMVLLIGFTQLEQLEQLYFGYEDLFTNTPTFVVSDQIVSFGSYQLNVAGASSFSECMASLLMQSGLALTQDIATFLLYGIEASTQRFTSASVQADTFEVAAQLLRSGARRSPVQQQLPTPHKEPQKRESVALKEEKTKEHKSQQKKK